MAIQPTQAKRTGSLSTALGKDKLVLTRADITEGLSELFEIQAEALSPTPNLDFKSAIGEKCCVTINSNDGNKRFFSGYVTAAQWTGRQNEFYTYRITARPWLWMLSQATNCRVFKDKTVLQIIKEILFEHRAYAVFRESIHSSYEEIRYCVQYRETDLDFICRLMEEFGIYYFFEHTESQHLLVLADSRSSHIDKEGATTVPYRSLEGNQRRKTEHYFSWTTERTFNPGKVVFKDYDFKSPGAGLTSEAVSGGGYKNDALEIYDYPGRYKKSGLGNKLAQVHLESLQARDKRCYADGDSVFSMPGTLVTLSEHKEASLNGKYLITRAIHSFSGDEFRSSGRGSGDELYSGRYEFLPKDVQFRAQQVTPRPVIHGAQTAVVVSDGKAGNEEIDVDKDGCILVSFHWDRKHIVSRRVRIAQVWAGQNWGGIFIPRVGMEVVVQFVEGDPDRPLVTGVVYNGTHMPPYDLPGEKTVAGWKTNSTKGGGGYNELVFDDKKGSELIRMHAQKDLKSKVGNNENRHVVSNITKTVGGSETVNIGDTYHLTAKKKVELIVGKSSIVMEPGTITIKSPVIKIEADVSLTGTSKATTMNGDVTLTLTGKLVLIN